MPSRSLNMGCGRDIRQAFVNADCKALKGVQVVCDFSRFPWPFVDNAFDRVLAIHVIERLPKTVSAMEELYRITGAGREDDNRSSALQPRECVQGPDPHTLFHGGKLRLLREERAIVLHDGTLPRCIRPEDIRLPHRQVRSATVSALVPVGRAVPRPYRGEADLCAHHRKVTSRRSARDRPSP